MSIDTSGVTEVLPIEQVPPAYDVWGLSAERLFAYTKLLDAFLERELQNGTLARLGRDNTPEDYAAIMAEDPDYEPYISVLFDPESDAERQIDLTNISKNCRY